MSGGVLTKVQIVVLGCFNKSLFSWDVLTKEGLPDARIRYDQIGSDRIR